MNADKETALKLAVCKRISIEQIKLLLKFGALTVDGDFDGSALQEAICRCSIKTIKIMI